MTHQIKLPPLPKWMIAFSIPTDDGEYGEGHQWLNERMQAYAIQARNEALEEAANICDENIDPAEAAFEIRALKIKEQ